MTFETVETDKAKVNEDLSSEESAWIETQGRKGGFPINCGLAVQENSDTIEI